MQIFKIKFFRKRPVDMAAINLQKITKSTNGCILFATKTINMSSRNASSNCHYFLSFGKNGNYMNLFNAEISEIILDCELGNFLPRI